MDIQSTTSVAAENTVAKIIKSIKVQRAETAGASSGKGASTVRLGGASGCLLCHCRWLHNSRLRPPASPSNAAARRSEPTALCLSTGASLLTPPTPAGTFTFTHVQVWKATEEMESLWRSVVHFERDDLYTWGGSVFRPRRRLLLFIHLYMNHL